MSEPTSLPPRPVSSVTIVFTFLGLCLFLLLARQLYVKHLPPAPQNMAPDKIAKDLQWKATPEARRAYLQELRDKQAKQAASYAWIDQGKGIVQVPIDRAMDLVVRQFGAKSAGRTNITSK